MERKVRRVDEQEGGEAEGVWGRESPLRHMGLGY